MTSFRVCNARDLGLQFTENPHEMVGQDGAFSIPLGPGETFWYFGDTLFGKRELRESLWFPGGKPLPPEDMGGHAGITRMLTNTGLILRQTTGAEGLTDFTYITDGTGKIRQLVPRVEGEDFNLIRVWCQHGGVINGTLYLSYINVRMLAEGPLAVNFEIIGAGLARRIGNTWDFQRIGSEDGTIWWGPNEPRFGSAILTTAGDGWIYFYGVVERASGGQECRVARVRPDDVEHLGRYEYLSSQAPAWSTRIEDAITVMEGIPNEMSVAWNPYLGCWLAVHSLDLSGLIVARTAPAPWGPWSDAVELWKVRPPKLDYEIPYATQIYAGKEHPELASQDGRTLYLTYIEFEEYFPHLVEVTLEKS